jgi:hypothetical protein
VPLSELGSRLAKRELDASGLQRELDVAERLAIGRLSAGLEIDDGRHVDAPELPRRRWDDSSSLRSAGVWTPVMSKALSEPSLGAKGAFVQLITRQRPRDFDRRSWPRKACDLRVLSASPRRRRH